MSKLSKCDFKEEQDKKLEWTVYAEDYLIDVHHSTCANCKPTIVETLVFIDDAWMSDPDIHIDTRFRLPGNRLSDVDSFLANLSDHNFYASHRH